MTMEEANVEAGGEAPTEASDVEDTKTKEQTGQSDKAPTTTTTSSVEEPPAAGSTIEEESTTNAATGSNNNTSDNSDNSSLADHEMMLIDRVEALMTNTSQDENDDSNKNDDNESKKEKSNNATNGNSQSRWSLSSLWPSNRNNNNKATSATTTAATASQDSTEHELARADSSLQPGENSNPKLYSITIVKGSGDDEKNGDADNNNDFWQALQQMELETETIATTEGEADKEEETTTIVRITSLPETTTQSAFQLFHDTPLQAGDIIQQLNGQACINHETVLETMAQAPPGAPLALTMESPAGNPVLVQAIVHKPSSESKLGVQLLNVDQQGKQQERNKPNDDKNGILQINQLDPQGLLFHSVLAQGDWVLNINDDQNVNVNATQLPATEAAQLILDAPERVVITAMRPPSLDNNNNTDGRTTAQKWLRHAKRAGIAIGGGTMVGVGLIFIPTLPPPFGEVLIAGGVSVLGTEFEGPKRVVRSARDSLERAVGRNVVEKNEENDKKEEENETTRDSSASKDETESSNAPGEEFQDEDETSAAPEAKDAATSTTETSSSTTQQQPKKKTMGDRFKNFGRNVVLPFLDQVVGDKKEEEGKSSSDNNNDSNEKDSSKVSDASPKSNAERTASLEQDEEDEQELANAAASEEKKSIAGTDSNNNENVEPEPTPVSASS